MDLDPDDENYDSISLILSMRTLPRTPEREKETIYLEAPSSSISAWDAPFSDADPSFPSRLKVIS